MRRITILLTSLLLAVASLSACGGTSPTATAAGNSGSAHGNGSPVAFARCMRANGVPNFPDPPGGGLTIQRSLSVGGGQSLKVNGVPVNAPGFQSAMRKCQRYAPFGGHPSAQQIAQLRAAALAMARCMRTHGVPNFPDPQVTTGPMGGLAMRIGPGAGVDPQSPAFQAAARVCKPLGLKGPPGGASGGATAPAG